MVFTRSEDTWLTELAPHSAVIKKNQNVQRTSFLRWLFDAFFKQFPMRHPRLADHIPHTKDEETLTLYGGDYWRMQEQLRNKMNTICSDLRKRLGRVPAPVGVLQLNETFNDMRIRLRGQGFIDIGAHNACGPSKTIDSYTRRAGVRIQTYPGLDYASCTNEERVRALADLPGDLFELVQVLHARTGAEIYVMAAWRDQENTQVWTDVVSPRSERYCNTQEIQEARKNFVQFQIDNNYYFYGPQIHQAGPAIFWAFDGSLRPWMPRVNLPLLYMQALLLEYFVLFYAWQGGQGELDFDCPDLVDPRRLIAELTKLSHPHAWTEVITLAVYAHVLSSQIGETAPEKRFQFYNLGAGQTQEGLCEDIAPNSSLQYPVQSRYYVARLQNDTSETPELKFEIQGLLPYIDGDFEPYEPLLGEESTLIGEYSGDYGAILDLIHAVSHLESAGPISAKGGHWSRVQRECVWFRHVPPEAENCFETLDGPFANESFFHPKPREMDDRSIARFSTFIRSGILTHELTRTIFGGKYGVRWPATQLFIFWYSIKALHNDENMPYRVRQPIQTTATLQFLHSDIVWLTEEINRSVERLEEIRSWQISFPSPAPIAFKQASLHAVAIIDGSPETQEQLDHEDESDSSPKQSTPRKRSESSVARGEEALAKSPIQSIRVLEAGDTPSSPPDINRTNEGSDSDSVQDNTEAHGSNEEEAQSPSEGPDMDVDEADQYLPSGANDSDPGYDIEPDSEFLNDTFADIASRVIITRPFQSSESSESASQPRSKRTRFALGGGDH